MNESEAMARCLELALGGWGRVAPNPLVGCVLLRDGEILGEGFHGGYGEAHAEVEALEKAGDAAGATCVVNLEPCNHRGNTPPCSQALLQAGVTRIVIGMADPNPEATGAAGLFRERGVEVVFDDLDGRVRALNAAFTHRHLNPTRPWTALKLAVTVDGYLADVSGASRWISGPEARDWVQWLRAGFDAVGVGRLTAAVDDPILNVRGPVRPRIPPTRLVFVRNGLLSPESRLLQSADQGPVAVVGIGETSDVTAYSSATYTINANNLENAVLQLRDRGIGSLLVEGGGRIASALLAEGLVDRVYLVVSPRFLGDGVRAFPTATPTQLGDSELWSCVERRALGRDTLITLDKE
ncbi:MAG: bifunctional diaminohydroxyphosphoribosylaminopyrimidine deaminase/5-amino-6-(5-phosphoribosylamino)uracil reductase RibD [Gemmatimonadales bacterium]